MSEFVLDASVAMRWLLHTNKVKDQEYAWSVLTQLEDFEALVPAVWHLEIGNVLVSAEKRKHLRKIDADRFVEQLEALSVRVDHLTSGKAFNRTLALARTYRLTSYDASYLELAAREALPISTLDKNLRRAAGKLDLPIFLR